MRRLNDPDGTSQTVDRNEPEALPEGAREETTVQVAVPPIIDPDTFERFEGFRETTLALFTDAKANETLRRMADFLYTVCLEHSRYWPSEPEGSFRHQCRAAVADLRHLQGYLALLSELEDNPSESKNRIPALCGRLSARVKKIANALEKALLPQPEDE
jgi:hypothetical protein